MSVSRGARFCSSSRFEGRVRTRCLFRELRKLPNTPRFPLLRNVFSARRGSLSRDRSRCGEVRTCPGRGDSGGRERAVESWPAMCTQSCRGTAAAVVLAMLLCQICSAEEQPGSSRGPAVLETCNVTADGREFTCRGAGFLSILEPLGSAVLPSTGNLTIL